MSTRALIIGKAKDGTYRYGQSKYDGDRNTEWLQKNMTDPEKVDEFLRYLTEGGEDGDGHGISCLGYKRVGSYLDYKYDYDQPKIEWYDESYNCGISKTKKAVMEMVKRRYFDFPEYISYWDGKKWKNL